MNTDVFHAIADPTRREILELLSKESMNMNAVSGNFPVSRAAIYKHIMILASCGLVAFRQQGRERFCEGHFDKLDAVTGWVECYRKIWSDRFDQLDEYLDEVQKNKKKRSPKKK